MARSSRDANQVHRLLALAAIYEGGTRSDAAQLGGVGLQTVRDWAPGGVPLLDLAQWVWDGFAVSISKQTLSRELRAMGYRKLSARPRHHAQNDDAIPTFKKTSPPRWRRSAQHSRAAR